MPAAASTDPSLRARKYYKLLASSPNDEMKATPEDDVHAGDASGLNCLVWFNL